MTYWVIPASDGFAYVQDDASGLKLTLVFSERELAIQHQQTYHMPPVDPESIESQTLPIRRLGTNCYFITREGSERVSTLKLKK